MDVLVIRIHIHIHNHFVVVVAFVALYLLSYLIFVKKECSVVSWLQIRHFVYSRNADTEVQPHSLFTSLQPQHVKQILSHISHSKKLLIRLLMFRIFGCAYSKILFSFLHQFNTYGQLIFYLFFIPCAEKKKCVKFFSIKIKLFSYPQSINSYSNKFFFLHHFRLKVSKK